MAREGSNRAHKFYTDHMYLDRANKDVHLYRKGADELGVNDDINIGANKIKTTNLALKEETSSYWSVRNAADTTYRGIWLDSLIFRSEVFTVISPAELRAVNADNGYLVEKARDNGVGTVEIARFVGGPEPFKQLTSLGFGVITKTADYTPANDAVILCDASAGAFTVSLPTASGIKGKAYFIKKVDASANAVTVDPYGTETIDGAATVSLAAQYDSVFIVSDGANWMKL